MSTRNIDNREWRISLAQEVGIGTLSVALGGLMGLVATDSLAGLVSVALALGAITYALLNRPRSIILNDESIVVRHVRSSRRYLRLSVSRVVVIRRWMNARVVDVAIEFADGTRVLWHGVVDGQSLAARLSEPHGYRVSPHVINKAVGSDSSRPFEE